MSTDSDIQPTENASATDSAFTIEEVNRVDFFSALPTEISLKILSQIQNSFFNTHVLSLVSKRWMQLAKDNEVWKSIYIHRYGKSKHQLQHPYQPRVWKQLYAQRTQLNHQWNHEPV
jgi:hypothetical protein